MNRSAPHTTTSPQVDDSLNTVDELAKLLKAAGDPLRLAILRVLSTESFGVLELCHLFGIKQSGMSHHLKVLATAELLTTRREGNSVFYRRNPLAPSAQFERLQQSILCTLDTLAIDSEVAERIEFLHQQRAQASQTFFADQTAAFKEKQDLIAAFSVYSKQVSELLDNTTLPAADRVMEIGPGAGEFLPSLSKRFTHVTALDNSLSMLQQAEHSNAALPNIHYVHNDTRFCHTQTAHFDCIVINMVLHHTPSPAQIFSDTALALKQNGALIICDLCNHNQDWAREACGDVWLGFDPHDLSRWATESKFIEGQSIYFALRNGFQIQLRQFIKEQ